MAKTPHDDVFRLAPKRQQSRADITDATVRAILTEENAERTALTRKRARPASRWKPTSPPRRRRSAAARVAPNARHAGPAILR